MKYPGQVTAARVAETQAEHPAFALLLKSLLSSPQPPLGSVCQSAGWGLQGSRQGNLLKR